MRRNQSGKEQEEVWEVGRGRRKGRVKAVRQRRAGYLGKKEAGLCCLGMTSV